MKTYRHSILIGAALFMGQSGAATAGGLMPAPEYPPEPYETYKGAVEVPVPVVVQHDWYLRGFIGMTNQDVDDITNTTIQAGSFQIEQTSFDSSPFIGGGIGFIANEHIRFDLTSEYRGGASFRGLDTYVDPGCGPGVCTNEHTGVKREWLMLANAYWDIFTMHGVTPYVGGGIGAARVTLDDFWDVNLVTNGLHWADDNSEWNFAWALTGGFAYELTPNLTFDVAYRYTETGDGTTGPYFTYDPAAPQPQDPTTLEDIHSHDILVGLRWNFGYEEAIPIAYK